jgi:hypothetical protein
MTKRILLTLLAMCWLIGPSARAAHDPAPARMLSVMEGVWEGRLSYRDYQPPHAMVQLPTRLFVAAEAADTLVLHFVYDDGPGKIVHGYQRMRFDLAGRTLAWRSGSVAPENDRCAILQVEEVEGRWAVSFECPPAPGDESSPSRHRLDLSDGSLTLQKEEKTGEGWQLRNRYEFHRTPQ